MPEQYFCLPYLTAEEILALLANTIASPGVDSRAFELLKTCQIVVGDPTHTLYLHQSAGGPLGKDVEPFHAKLIAEYGISRSQNVGQENRINGAGQPVGAAACVLLHLCRGTQQPDPQRFMLAGRNLPTERVTALFNMIHTVATEVTVAYVKSSSREADSVSFVLFDINADRSRYAAVTAMLAGDAFDDCTRLARFGSRYGAIFLALPSLREDWRLPTATGLNERSLDNFLRLLHSSPQTFGLPHTNDERLLAIIPNKAVGFSVLPLAGQSFHQLFRGLNPAEAVAEVVELSADDAAMQRLEKSLAGEPVQVGYRLQLQPNRGRRLKDEQHIHRIRAQMEKLAQDLAYNWNLGLVRPKLWRFSQSQLPAMIDTLASFPMQDLKSGRILYGYAAARRHAAGQGRLDYDTSPDFAEGMHYLYVSQDAFMANGNPLPYWEGSLGQLNPTIRYWLDPFWARFYHPANEALVFVPEGTVLSPPIHRAEIEDMDAYLRKALPRWFPGAFGGGTVAARKPIYLFDGYTSGNRPIIVTVLDLAEFRPLAAEIGWINDNLLLMETLDVRLLITQMAEDGARTRLAEAVGGQRKQAVQDLNAASAALSGELANKTAELARVMTEELQASLATTDKTVTEIQDLDQKLNKYRAVYAQMKGLHAEAETLLNNLLAAETELDQRIHDLEGSVKRSVSSAEQTRKQLEREIEQEANHIELTYQELMARINRMP